MSNNKKGKKSKGLKVSTERFLEEIMKSKRVPKYIGFVDDKERLLVAEIKFRATLRSCKKLLDNLK